MGFDYEKVEKAWFKPKKPFDEYIDKQCDYYRQTINTDYEYFKTLFSKSTKEDVLMALTEKCEELQRLYISYYKLLCKEHVENNIISELEEWLKEQRDYYYEYPYYSDFNAYGSNCDDVLDKIQELKKKECR